MNNTGLELICERKYLGATIQSELKFTSHVQAKISKPKKQLGMVKRALHSAPKDAKRLAYTSLCRPHVEYASSVWDPVFEYQIYVIEMVQHNAMRFICNPKGRDSISAAFKKLNLETLSKRRQTNRYELFCEYSLKKSLMRRWHRPMIN